MRFQKRYSFSPSCFITYNLENGADIYIPNGETLDTVLDRASGKDGSLDTPGFMSLVASFEGYLNIYKDIKLSWTTKMQLVPIFVQTANFQGRTGLIVTLSDSGDLQISFLGTDQMTQTDLGKLHQSEKDIDY